MDDLETLGKCFPPRQMTLSMYRTYFKSDLLTQTMSEYECDSYIIEECISRKKQSLSQINYGELALDRRKTERTIGHRWVYKN